MCMLALIAPKGTGMAAKALHTTPQGKSKTYLGTSRVSMNTQGVNHIPAIGFVAIKARAIMRQSQLLKHR